MGGGGGDGKEFGDSGSDCGGGGGGVRGVVTDLGKRMRERQGKIEF